jgi:DNA-binding transcriptional LysR family regulator
MDLEVRHLRVIYTIAEAGSLRRASTVLHVSQPALTAQLQRIERLVGGRLFRRGQAGAVPTVLGVEFLTRARSILHAFEQLQRDMAVGLDGYGTSSVEQTGSEADCAGGRAEYSEPFSPCGDLVVL